MTAVEVRRVDVEFAVPGGPLAVNRFLREVVSVESVGDPSDTSPVTPFAGFVAGEVGSGSANPPAGPEPTAEMKRAAR